MVTNLSKGFVVHITKRNTQQGVERCAHLNDPGASDRTGTGTDIGRTHFKCNRHQERRVSNTTTSQSYASRTVTHPMVLSQLCAKQQICSVGKTSRDNQETGTRHAPPSCQECLVPSNTAHLAKETTQPDRTAKTTRNTPLLSRSLALSPRTQPRTWPNQALHAPR